MKRELSGMLFPDGEVPKYDRLAELVNAGIRAVRAVSPEIKILIHLDQGGRFYYLKEWFDAMFLAGMDDIDMIGISFYSFWHGTYMDLKDSMSQLIKRYELPVFIVETAHPWRQCEDEHISAEMMQGAGLDAGIMEQKKAMEIILQTAAEVSGESDTGVYYWEPLSITGGRYGTWDENMGMVDDTGRALPAFDAFGDFDPLCPPIKELDTYTESLYKRKSESVPAPGVNLLTGGSFENGLADWWTSRSSDDIEVEVNKCGEGDDVVNEICVSSKANFYFKLYREMRIEKAGRYRLSVDYRGTNTTGVKISLFLKTISCNGEKILSKNIFPSDVDFITYVLETEELPVGSLQLGIEMDTPPVFGRIRNFRLTQI